MGFTLLLWIALALAIFWAVGLHNRLMRLRAAAVEGAAAFDKQAQSFIGMTQDFALVAGLRFNASTDWLTKVNAS